MAQAEVGSSPTWAAAGEERERLSDYGYWCHHGSYTPIVYHFGRVFLSTLDSCLTHQPVPFQTSVWIAQGSKQRQCHAPRGWWWSVLGAMLTTLTHSLQCIPPVVFTLTSHLLKSFLPSPHTEGMHELPSLWFYWGIKEHLNSYLTTSHYDLKPQLIYDTWLFAQQHTFLLYLISPASTPHISSKATPHIIQGLTVWVWVWSQAVQI